MTIKFPPLLTIVPIDSFVFNNHALFIANFAGTLVNFPNRINSFVDLCELTIFEPEKINETFIITLPQSIQQSLKDKKPCFLSCSGDYVFFIVGNTDQMFNGIDQLNDDIDMFFTSEHFDTLRNMITDSTDTAQLIGFQDSLYALERYLTGNDYSVQLNELAACLTEEVPAKNGRSHLDNLKTLKTCNGSVLNVLIEALEFHNFLSSQSPYADVGNFVLVGQHHIIDYIKEWLIENGMPKSLAQHTDGSKVWEGELKQDWDEYTLNYPSLGIIGNYYHQKHQKWVLKTKRLLST